MDTAKEALETIWNDALARRFASEISLHGDIAWAIVQKLSVHEQNITVFCTNLLTALSSMSKKPVDHFAVCQTVFSEIIEDLEEHYTADFEDSYWELSLRKEFLQTMPFERPQQGYEPPFYDFYTEIDDATLEQLIRQRCSITKLQDGYITVRFPASAHYIDTQLGGVVVRMNKTYYYLSNRKILILKEK